MKIEKLACPNCNAPLSGDFAPNQKVDCSHCDTPLLITSLQTDHPIFCPGCHVLNSDEVRFCVNCGEKLKRDCVLCYTENRIDTDYCAKCGAHLDHAEVRRNRLRETTNLLRQERLELLKEKEARQKEEKLERLLDALDEPENHDSAIQQINQMGMMAVDALIETLLEDEDVDARYGSARALGRIMAEHKVKVLDKGRTNASKALIKALSDVELPVRYWAVEALGKCSSNLAITPLSKLLDDEHEGIRTQARQALQNIGGTRVEQVLAEYKPKKRGGWFAR